jgi:hypothetical protein
MDECEHGGAGDLKTGRKESYSIATGDVSAKSMKSTIEKESGKETPIDNCPYHVGYLKNRSKDQAVPDSCLTCPKILQCMV